MKYWLIMLTLFCGKKDRKMGRQPIKSQETFAINVNIKVTNKNTNLCIRGHIVVNRYTTGYHIKGLMSSFINA